MKALRFAFISVLLSMFVSCNDNKIKQPAGITGLTDDVHFEQQGEIQSIGMIEHCELLLQEATESNADDTELIKYLQDQLDEAEEYQESLIKEAGANYDPWMEGSDGMGAKNRAMGYQFATIRYRSIDHKGNPIMLSTLVVWPYNNIFPNPDADNVIIGCHVTYGSNAERPTNYNMNSIKSDVGMLAICAKSNFLGASSENLVIIPDYQGYGATHGDIHPYLSQELTARQVLDGVRAGIEYYREKHNLEKGWRSVSAGYSQGGSVAMAVHRYIEKNNLESEFNFAGSVCGNGPYDPIATLQTYLKMETYGRVYMPVSAAMMMYSMCNTNPRLMGKYSPGDFMTKEFLDSDIITMIESKDKDTDMMQEELLEYSASDHEEPDGKFYMERKATDGFFYPYTKDTKDQHDWEPGYIKTAYASPTQILERNTYDYFSYSGNSYEIKQYPERYAHAKVLWSALEDNVLHLDWKPAHPIFLYHTEEDEVVVYQNFSRCLDAWIDSDYVKGTIYKGTTYTHVSYGTVFYLFHCRSAISAILNNETNEYPFLRKLNGDW